jgi:hypothetical protein
MAFPPIPQHSTEPFDPAKDDPVYSWEHRFEHTSEGGFDTYDVIDSTRGKGDPVATCDHAEDAMMITDALNRL